jgi:hypothetical protein
MCRLYLAEKRLRVALLSTSGSAMSGALVAGAATGMVAPPLREGSLRSPSLRSGATIPVSLFNSAIPILDFLPTLYIKLTWGRCLIIIGTEGKLGLTGEARKALRQAKSVPILEDIKAYLEREQPAVLPKSPEGTAISYTLSNWDALVRYCDDGDLEIDNNGAERSLRGIAVGRRNWTFLGSDNGGRTAAILTSITTTCKRLGVDPFEYLRDVFERISTHPQNTLDDLLPDSWKVSRPATTP